MLVLTRKPGERVLIGPNIEVVVVEVHGDRVRLGFECPSHIRILREELCKDQAPLHEDDSDVTESFYHAECA